MQSPVSKPAPPPQIGAQIAASSSRSASPLILDKSTSPALKGRSAEKAASPLKGSPAENGQSPHKGSSTKNGPSSLKGKLPGTARKDKPPVVPGYEWSPQSRGFTCREVTGQGKDRQRRYIGFLSGKRWEQMRSEHSGRDLRAAVQAWIDSKAKGGKGK